MEDGSTVIYYCIKFESKDFSINTTILGKGLYMKKYILLGLNYNKIVNT